MKKIRYHVTGLHCASCELIIEKNITRLPGIQGVKFNSAKNQLEISFLDQPPQPSQLNKIFAQQGYSFSTVSSKHHSEATYPSISSKTFWLSLVIAALVILVFYLVSRASGLNQLTINNQSSLVLIFFFGLVASVSSCAALVGGIVLALSGRWQKTASPQASFFQSSRPHLLFNLGRLLSFTFFGGLLGWLGSSFQLNSSLSAWLVIVVSLFMIVTGLGLIGIQTAGRWQPRLPKFIQRYLVDEKNFSGRWMPFLWGAGTFFLPCGFTLSVQAVALLSGSYWLGAASMFIFALGTLPMLLFIGLSSVKLLSQPLLANYFSTVAGILVIVFGLFNINAQLNLLNLPSLNNIFISRAQSPATSGQKAGQQFIEMTASANGYSPNFFQLQAGVPVVWTIHGQQTSGCTNSLVAPGLVTNSVNLAKDHDTVVEFTPSKPGNYKFSCWMGMITGEIQVTP
jgi:uncharacterized protein